ncbi:MAG: cysteine methyltransferase [Candidatus Aenigmatarchaeota archaeon]|nr:MAG: cysteine methyltransferase [Candidatus Aenigmarchaeota archaeon]
MMENNKVFKLLRKIPEGKITTYKEIGLKLNLNPRIVGRILSENEDLENIKCYKVVKSDGKVGGYKLGIKEKIKRLEKDGIKVENGRIVDFEKRVLRFS